MPTLYSAPPINFSAKNMAKYHTNLVLRRYLNFRIFAQIFNSECHFYIQMTVLPKVRSALCAASQLPGEGSTDVEDAHTPAR